MENKVYYGEYTLLHWINLILKGNIELPEYQRSFCWDKNDVKTLIDTLKAKRFVPPITIGAFRIDDGNKNYIIDGQQRLTSVLLSYLGKFPKKDSFDIININNNEEIEEIEENEEDEQNDTTEESSVENRDLRYIKWTFKKLIEKGRTKAKILESIENNKYEDIETIDDKFLEETFMGFSYIVPNTNSNNQQQEFYSSVFRDINRQGKGLTPLETRRSFYFLDANFIKFFEPECVERLKDNGEDIDFIRYITLLSDTRPQKAKGYSGKRNQKTGEKKTLEDYYLKYIYHIIGKEKVDFFKEYTDIFENNNVRNDRFETLSNTINQFLRNKNFSTFMECDIYMFGLVNKILFEGKKIDMTKVEDLKSDLNNKSNELKQNYTSSSRYVLKYINDCLISSIEIYNKYEEAQP